jgi:hypothetical protein
MRGVLKVSCGGVGATTLHLMFLMLCSSLKSVLYLHNLTKADAFHP